MVMATGSDNMSSSSSGSGSAQTADEELRVLLEAAAREFPAYVQHALSAQSPIVASHSAASVAATLPLTFPDRGLGATSIWADIHAVLSSATNTWSPRFLYKLYASPTPIGVLSETLLGLLNNNAHVFASSPSGAVIEHAVGRQLCQLANMPSETSAGLTFPGGSYANMHALVAARNTRFPECRKEGLWALARRGVRPVVFTSAHAHYSVEKAAVAAGLGRQGVVVVPTDDRGCMDPAALRTLVEGHVAQGDAPFFVNATAGTTVLGAFDPLDALAALCDEFDMWLHVDASWGGPLLLFGPPHVDADSRAQAAQVAVAAVPRARVHSLTVNPHKLLGIPMHCSFLLVRDGLGVMRQALGLGASYLYHGDTEEADEGLGGSWDFGDATLACGRRPDAIKMWLAWRYHGTQYLRSRVARARQLALDFARMVEDRGTAAVAAAAAEGKQAGLWRLVGRPEGTTVCFWHVPQALMRRQQQQQGDAVEPEPQQWWGDVARLVCRRVNEGGGALIDYATVDRFAAASAGHRAHALPHFFRIPFNNPEVSSDTQCAVLDAIECAARELAELGLI
ncbi:Glutamate decarboxylase 2 [Coemansia erecta]|uniref:Glutamate decarboxylase 2 n=1 Tax=Coemansia erecta TaxID=147472 RepID=A0A9W7XZE1_9FUNG|nr:Glutamate decarboxylase 2 [Coemansia erecta]